jgi:carbon-monoxide dehydrogenase iron sulfur subunit
MEKASRKKPVRIHWDKKACTTCMSCVVVCSERQTGMSAPSRSRVRIWVDLLGGDCSAAYCRQCANAPCAAACPVEAIWFDEALGAWLLNEQLCTSCGECVGACPFDAIWLYTIGDVAIKCDLCSGAARCVEICPSNALTLRGMRKGRVHEE